MTTPVHLYFVLDHSGSMAAIRDDVIGGFNSFVDEQRKQPGECLVTLVQFDSQDPYEVLFDAVPLSELSALAHDNFQPRGNTPLYDAMGHSIANAAIRMEKRAAAGRGAEQILFVTMTDGQENASREYTKDKVFAAITARTESGWTFAYLGANQDAFAEGGAIGYAAGSTRGYNATAQGTAGAFASLSRATSGYRSRVSTGTAQGTDFYADDENVSDADRAVEPPTSR